ncbi:MAG: PD-(D/E)XK nuclease family protein [Burkholderiales bacterium]|nr:PD-(D/E)XK nuclease family protein [Burkholderiales bacterium]
MSPPDFAAALAAGVTIVTPNNRLARALVARHDEAMRERGARAWPAARVLPWQAWLRGLWQDALAADALDPAQPLLAEAASAFLWDRIVGETATLLDPRGAAERAAEAWTLFHAWREPDESHTAWARAGIADDVAAFARWADRYAASVAAAGAVDAAHAADALAAAATRIPAWRDADVVLAGFFAPTRQQSRLVAALRAAGTRVAEAALPRGRAGRTQRVACATPQAELVAALRAARARCAAEPGARIGLVFGDLDDRRHEVVAAADDILCPEIAARPDAESARPYALSLGTRLPEVPMAAAALALVAWSAAPLPVEGAGALLRSPYLPDGDRAWRQRARVADAWREQGIREVSFAAAAKALAETGDAALANAWRSAAPPPAGRQSPAAWAQAWRAWLTAAGWPGERALASSEWQARERVLEALGAFAALGGVAHTLARDDAVRALRAAFARIVFQPEAPPAPIQILGVLEASGLDFDLLWLAGMAAERWPQPVAPSPLLPLAWQRARGVPRSDASGALAFARTVTAAFAHAADDVIASHAVLVDGFERAGSALTAAWPAGGAPEGDPRAGRAWDLAVARPPLPPLADDTAPALPAGVRVRGGVDVVESQSACPFQAYGHHRLRARAAPVPDAGLTPLERGALLHRALAAFWEDVRTHAALAALDDTALRARIDAAVAAARPALGAPRWRSLPPPVAAAENARLAATLHGWLTAIERERPPFTVIATEADATLALGGLDLAFRIDRVDALADGGTAIIDYKSGRVPVPKRWFALRPAGTQVGLYALARAASDPDARVRAVAYAQLKAGSVAVAGLAADAHAWPALRVPGGDRHSPVARWEDAQAFWRDGYGEIAAAFRAGHAAVAPRDAKVCAYCDLQPLCRVQLLEEAGDDDEDAHDD